MPLSSSLAVALVLSAKTSSASRAINRFSSRAEKRLAQITERSQNLMASGFVDMQIGKSIGRALLKPIKSFAELENSATDLKVSMMDAAGKVPASFKKLSDLALQLGNKLPGSTSDMNNLFNTMINNGAKAEDILKGTGKAAAYLAVGMKMPFEEAGQMAQRLQIATGVLNKDMIKFMDTISRTKNLGVSVSDLQYAFSKSAGTLKTMGLQGLEASKKVSVLYAILNRAGMSGETIGTSMSKVFNTFLNPKKMAAFNSEAHRLGLSFQFVDKETGRFLGVKNMMAQLEKINNLNPKTRAILEGKLFASGQAKNAFDILIGQGASGFTKIQAAMEKQASLNKKVNAQLSTLTNIWDAFTGTLDNTLALIGQKYGKQIKSFVGRLTNMAEAVGTFADKHPTLVKWITVAIGAFSALTIVTGALKIAIGGGIMNVIYFIKSIKKIKETFDIVSDALKANPWILIVTAIALVAIYVIKNWDQVKAFFIKLWADIKRIFSNVWQWIKRMFLNYTPYGLIIKNWSKITGFFSTLWDKVKGSFSTAWQWIKEMFLAFSLPGMIITHWSQIGVFFSTLWENIKKSFFSFVNFFKSKWDWINNHIIQPIAGWFGGDSNVNVSASKSGGSTLPQPVPVRNNSVNAPFTMNLSLSGGATQEDADRIVRTVKKHLPGMMKDYNHNLNRINLGF